MGNQDMLRFARSCPRKLPTPDICPFGGACHSCRTSLQPKLKISNPGDRYEREADAVSTSILRSHEPDTAITFHDDRKAGRRKDSEIGKSNEQRKKKEMEKSFEVSTRKVNEGRRLRGIVSRSQDKDYSHAYDTDLTSVKSTSSSGGSPIPENVRSFYESRFGRNFANVRIHSGKRAAESAHSINANAFTFGSDIVFGTGEYSPNTQKGKRLLAHELTHVVQQTHGVLWNHDEGSSISPITANTSSGPVVQRQTSTTTIPCDEDIKPIISDGIIEAVRLTDVAIAALDKRLTDEFDIDLNMDRALERTFGSATQQIRDRFQDIKTKALVNNNIYCEPASACVPSSANSRICARGAIGAYEIYICPSFGEEVVCEPGPTLLHEAAHNEGANHNANNPYDDAWNFELFPLYIEEGKTNSEQNRMKRPSGVLPE